jgi:hypothetical protein
MSAGHALYNNLCRALYGREMASQIRIAEIAKASVAELRHRMY